VRTKAALRKKIEFDSFLDSLMNKPNAADGKEVDTKKMILTK
jgi:hypothetical protein